MMEIFITPHDEEVEMWVNNKKVCAKLSKHIISLKYSFTTFFFFIMGIIYLSLMKTL